MLLCRALSSFVLVLAASLALAACGSGSERACVELRASDFDTSCQSDTDCMLIAVGSYCPDSANCFCPTASINVRDQSRYQTQQQAAENIISPSAQHCFCPNFGAPRCIANRCVLCGGIVASDPACPDGGG